MKKGQQSVVRLLTPISLSVMHKEIPEIGTPQEVQYTWSCFVNKDTMARDYRSSIRWFVLCASALNAGRNSGSPKYVEFDGK